MQKQSLILVLVLAAASLYLYSSETATQSPQELFDQWTKDYSSILTLSPEELLFRFKIFEKNLQQINEHNSRTDKSYKLGVNQFTGFTQEEFELRYLSKLNLPQRAAVEEEKTENLKLNIDWVSFGAVSPVKNAGTCLSSYAFSAVGAIEGISVIYFNTQQEYSVQQIVDCSQAYGNNGCNGGDMQSSFKYVQAKGINTQNAYPYTGKVGSCLSATGLFKIKGYSTAKTCSLMEGALSIRPVSVAVDGQNFAKYSSGIFDNCGKNWSLAALLVGATDQYYRVKNSWGTSWGESGYIRLSRSGDICGICDYVSYPLPA